MSLAEIEKNAATYKTQVFKILDPKKTKIVFNSHWLNKLTPQELMELSAHLTVAQILARADFKKRFESGKEISLMEFIYPLLQGYDSVHLNADVEIGGLDQKFNLLMGRQLQEAYGQKPQVVLMTPLLEGLDGVNKMSKSMGNAIGINDEPNDIFGKVMSISDELMFRYYEVLTEINLDDVKKMHPKEAKLQLAQTIVEMFHPSSEGGKARAHFESTFSQHQIPNNIPEHKIQSGQKLIDIMVLTQMAASKNEARRLIKEKAVTHEGSAVNDENWPLAKGVIKIGKRRFLKLK
jgi:tyrosyl-tRNA synthetase